jgi:hypothetical protein
VFWGWVGGAPPPTNPNIQLFPRRFQKNHLLILTQKREISTYDFE